MENSKKNIFWNIKGDIFGGITAGVIALPLALAFGVASGAGAAAGLYGAIFLGFFAALFGGTPTQVSGPTGPMTVVIAGIIATHPNNIQAVFLTIILAGLFQILFGLFKLGNLIKYVPYPVISGFMSGIGMIIIILQLNPLLGLPSNGSIINSLKETFTSLQNTNLHSLLLGAITLAIVFFMPKKWQRFVPAPLTALVIVTVLSIVLGFNVQTISDIPASLPSLSLPMVSWDVLKTLIPIALTLSILGCVDSLLTSLVADSVTKTKHNSNKEIIGQGIGNIVAGLFGGIAGAGATMRTVVNIKAGGRTRISGIVHSLFLLVILIGAAPLAQNIPSAVLAGILIKVGVDIVDYKFLKVLRNSPKRDLAVMVWVFFVTVFYDLIFAVATGIVLSSILFAISVAQQFNIEINDTHKIEDTDDDSVETKSKYAIRTLDIQGVLFFGSSSQFLSTIDDVLETKYLIINCQNVLNLDISASFALEDMIARTKDKDTEVLLVVNNEKITNKLEQLGVLNVLGDKNVFYSKEEAVSYAEQHL